MLEIQRGWILIKLKREGFSLSKDKNENKEVKKDKRKRKFSGNGLEFIWGYLENKSMWKIFMTGILTLSILLVAVVVGANKQGISHEEMKENFEKNEVMYEKDQKGHVGGDTQLIKEPLSNQVEVKDFNKEIEKYEEVYVYFYSDYCPFCLDVGDTVIDQLDKNGVDYLTVNINEEKEFQDKEIALPVPKIVRYEEGKRITEIVGVKTKEQYKEYIQGGK